MVNGDAEGAGAIRVPGAAEVFTWTPTMKVAQITEDVSTRWGPASSRIPGAGVQRTSGGARSVFHRDMEAGRWIPPTRRAL
jgi:hypothetical protein